MNERLKKLRKTLNLTQQEFADKLRISRNNIASYETNKSNMGDSTIALICREFHVNEDWLRNASGEMFVEQTMDEQIAAFVGSIQATASNSFKKNFISMLSRLDESDWKTLEKITAELHDKRG